MKTRTSQNWSRSPGGIDSLNLDLGDFSRTPMGLAKIKKQYKDWAEKPIAHGFNERRIKYPALIHSFIDDYRFNGLWSNPKKYEKKIKKREVWGVCSPDYSIDADMPLIVQMWQVYRSRRIACYWQELGVHVVLTLQWAGEDSLNFAFQGIEKGIDCAIDCPQLSPGDEEYNYYEGLKRALSVVSPDRLFVFGKLKYMPELNGVEVLRYPRTHFERK